MARQLGEKLAQCLHKSFISFQCQEKFLPPSNSPCSAWIWLAHNSHNIHPVSYSHQHQPSITDVNILKECGPYWYYFQSHYSGLLYPLEDEKQDEIWHHPIAGGWCNYAWWIILLWSLPPCHDNSLLSSRYIMSVRLWGTIAHLPRSSRKSPQ